MRPSPSLALTSVLAGLALLAGCDAPPREVRTVKSERPSVASGSIPAQRQQQVDFLNRIREADPNSRTIDRALLNEENELGLVLDRSVELDKIPELMRFMLTKMAAEFPNEDLTVLAYSPSAPPRKIGTARLNARTRDMTYSAEK